MNLRLLPLMPLGAVQGWRLRAVMPDPVPPRGQTTGVVGATMPLRLSLAVVGDSSAAGYGADTMSEGLAACLAVTASGRRGVGVAWQVLAEYGATMRRIRHRVEPRLDAGHNVVVLVGGANDAMVGRSGGEFRDDLVATLDALGRKCDHVVVAGLPRFSTFPRVPATLGRLLDARGRSLDRVAQEVCAARQDVSWSHTALLASRPEYFGSDRFHPSGLGYAAWAEELVDLVVGTSPASTRSSGGRK